MSHTPATHETRKRWAAYAMPNLRLRTEAPVCADDANGRRFPFRTNQPRAGALTATLDRCRDLADRR